MQPMYATASELADYLELAEPPANADRLLTRASRLVDGLLLTAVYDVDDAGMPTYTDAADALNQATLLQAAHWHENGEPGTGDAASWGNVKIGSVSLGSRTSAPGAGTVDGQTVAAGVTTVLQVAGLTPSAPYVYG